MVGNLSIAFMAVSLFLGLTAGIFQTPGEFKSASAS